MPAAGFRIRPEWPETMVYETEDGRSLHLDCVSMDEPPQVRVPAPHLWAARTPAWAHGERETIVARLRAAGCLIFEEAELSSALLSPDGALRVEREGFQEERSALHESIRVVAPADGSVLAHLLNYGGAEPARFPRPGVVVVELTDRLSQRRRIEIDAAARTFRALPQGDGAPLARLPGQLGYGPAAAPPSRPVLGRLLDALLALAGVLLTAGSIWMALAGQTARERWIGLFGTVFFGACAASALRGLLRRRP